MMIEKLEPYNSSRTSIDGIHWEFRPNFEDVINKINEIIDAVNANSLGFSIPLAYSRHSFLGVDPCDTEKSEPVRHGRWLDVLVADDDEGETDGVECSECGYTDINVYWAKTYHRFCPNCGAKMDKINQGGF